MAYPFSKVTEMEGVVGVKLSTDGGKHWTTVASRVSRYLSEPIAFDDGTGMLLYQNNKQREFLFPGGGASFTPPAHLTALGGVNGFAYGMIIRDGGPNTQVSTSTDRGKTWTTFEPR